MIEPRSYLFVTWEGGGNVPAVLGVARQLAARGHRVRVLAEPCMADAVTAAGAEFLPFTRHFTRSDAAEPLLEDFGARSPLAALTATFRGLMFGPAHIVADETRDAIAAQPTDVVVADYLMPGALVAAEAARIPRAVLWHAPEYLPGPGRPAAGPGFAPRKDVIGTVRDGLLTSLFLRTLSPFVADYNKVRQRYGLAPVSGAKDLFGEYHRADRRLIQTSKAFDFPLDPAPANVRYVGPVLDDPHWVEAAVTRSPDLDAGGRPLVVAGFSSTYQKQEAALRNTIEALGTLPVTALVSTGPSVNLADITGAGTPANVTVSRAVSHAAAFPLAAAVVTHAGHGTIMRALTAGAPLVCLPMGRDQDDNAAKIAYHGAGVRLPKTATPQRIAAAVRRVVDEPTFRETARRLGEQIGRDAAEQRAVTELEGLAAGQAGPQPSPRVDGTTETVIAA